MKRLLWAAAALAALLALAACGGKKSAESEAEEFRKELTKEDTTQMLALCNECMETLKAGRIDEALNRLYTYDDSTAVVDGRFVGLALDEMNEDSLTPGRIDAWIESLKKEGIE